MAIALPSRAYADCVSPAFPGGVIDYYSAGGQKVYRYCNGTEWITWAGEPVAGEPAAQFDNLLENLSDVNVPAPADGECLTWVNASSEWQSTSCGGGIGAVTGEPAAQFDNLLENLGDVNSPAPGDGECLKWVNGSSEWQPGNCAAIGSVTGEPAATFDNTLDNLADVDTSGVAAGNVILYSAGNWVVGTASGGGGSPGGADRQIQLNSAGAFAGDTNFVYTADGDFIVGSYQLDDTGTGSEDNRMFFDRSIGAFRAGVAQASQWDAANVGSGSVAFGLNNTASGAFSTALGAQSSATGDYSFAMGDFVTASGGRGVAMGSFAQASGFASMAVGQSTFSTGDRSIAMGGYTSAGAYSMAIGLTSTNPATDPKVTGQQSLGIFMGDQSGVDITQANAMVLMGGKMGIGDTTPDAELDVVGDIHVTGLIVDVSDMRMKELVRPLQNQLVKLTSLNGFVYTMKEDPDKKKEYGVSAQEVQKVFPEIVHQIDSNGTLGVNYGGFIAPMIEAFKEQQAQIEALEARIKELEARE